MGLMMTMLYYIFTGLLYVYIFLHVCADIYAALAASSPLG